MLDKLLDMFDDVDWWETGAPDAGSILDAIRFIAYLYKFRHELELPQKKPKSVGLNESGIVFLEFLGNENTEDVRKLIFYFSYGGTDFSQKSSKLSINGLMGRKAFNIKACRELFGWLEGGEDVCS